VRIVVDSNIFVGACLTAGAANQVIKSCIESRYVALLGNALFAEYEDVLARTRVFDKSRLSGKERNELFEIFLSASEWIRVYCQWRSNLRDEGDNRLMELAIADNAQCIVTRNVRDFAQAQLLFPQVSILTPAQLLKEFP
jgi:putative PIN family toxin of toxin-antitoxin system